MPDAGCGDGNQGRGNRGRRAVHLAFALSIDSPQWPRAVVTDKPFLSTFPCLADPLAHERAPAPPPTVDVSAALGSLRPSRSSFAICSPVVMLTIGAVILVIVVIAIPVWLISRWRWRSAA